MSDEVFYTTDYADYISIKEISDIDYFDKSKFAKYDYISFPKIKDNRNFSSITELEEYLDNVPKHYSNEYLRARSALVYIKPTLKKYFDAKYLYELNLHKNIPVIETHIIEHVELCLRFTFGLYITNYKHRFEEPKQIVNIENTDNYSPLSIDIKFHLDNNTSIVYKTIYLTAFSGLFSIIDNENYIINIHKSSIDDMYIRELDMIIDRCSNEIKNHQENIDLHQKAIGICQEEILKIKSLKENHDN